VAPPSVPAPVVEAVRPEPTVAVAEPAAAPVKVTDPDELAKLPPPKVKPPEQPNKSHPMIVRVPDIDCTADDDWKRSEISFASRVEGAYRERIQKKGRSPTRSSSTSSSGCASRFSEADDNRKCAKAHAAILQWAEANNR